MRKITESEFKSMKKLYLFHTARQIAAKHSVSVKTVLQARGSRTYKEYQEQVKAQHPETEYSLKDKVLDLHKIIFNKHDNLYLAPTTARQAILELQLNAIKESKK